MAEGMWSGGNRQWSRAPGEMRIGDAERERAAEDLRAHTVAGRLTMDEYAERLEAVYEARTVAALAPIMADLPPLRPAQAPPPPAGGAFPGAGAPAGYGASPSYGATPSYGAAADYGPLPGGRPGIGVGRRGGVGACGRRHAFPGSRLLLWLVVAVVLTVATHGVIVPVWIVAIVACSALSRRGRWRAASRR